MLQHHRRPVGVQRQMGHRYYKQIWYILQKIRYAMGKMVEDYQLCDEVELEENGARYKRGEGSQKQARCW